VRLCQTISCDLAGKAAIAQYFRKGTRNKFGETTPDKKFTLEYCNCIGMCDQGPALLINEQVFTKVTQAR
jgi:[NiFe] hydrogenase diaphorase moiety large subunit